MYEIGFICFLWLYMIQIEDSKRSQLKHVICANRGKIRVPQVTIGIGLKLIGWEEIVFIVIG